ncbi:MAG: ATP-binding protein [Clostridia bacterium]
MEEKIYKREEYLKRIRGFYNSDMIKVITGIRRCGKSTFLKSVILELKEKGVPEKDIIYLELDKKEYRNIKKPEQLEKEIEKNIKDTDFKYLLIDEIQNVKNYEPIINAYREEGNFSIFITGSNSYLLSGELMTKLTGRYIEIEMMPLNFYEYIDMKKFYEKQINPNIYKEFEEYIKNGGFPGALFYDDYEDKMTYITNVINQIVEKDIKKNNKIRNIETFELIQKYVINNFGAIISVKKIYEYFKNEQKINIDRRTIKRNIEILEKAKIIYPCELFDIKSKNVLKGEKKYYLADFSIYYALNTDNRINYGPMLGNIIYIYLKSKNYKLSVGRIGKLECNFIARKGFDKYFYIQISKTIEEDRVEEREYKPFYDIKDMYPRYLFTMDLLLQNRDGVNNVNIADFISENKEL